MNKKLKPLLVSIWLMLPIFMYGFVPIGFSGGGNGTQATPYGIANLDDLKLLSTTSSYWAEGLYFIQTADIDASETSTWNDNGSGGYYGFSPIGNGTTQFQGNYDGKGYTISNLFINRLEISQGLFGSIENNATIIKNLGVLNVNFAGGSFSGGLVGYVYDCNSISNCYCTGNITGDGANGGLVGTIQTGSISNCYSAVNVTGTGNYCGGLVGSIPSPNTTISNSYSTGNVTGTTGVGGLVGINMGTISNCYSTGNVTRSSGTDTKFGGFVAWHYEGTITNSYSTGWVKYTGTTNPTDKGFAGAVETGTFTSCFWDTETSVQATTAGTATGRTTTQMKTQGTFTGWDFATPVWEIDGTNNNGYPYLEWQIFTPTAIQVTATEGTPEGEYNTLKDAFDMINLGMHNGNIQIKINESILETDTCVLNASGLGSAEYDSILIYPTVTGLSITGDMELPLIDLNGADNVTIDGRVNATGDVKDLVISNTSYSSVSGTSTIRFINDASANTVKYCTLKGSSTVARGGILMFGTTTGTTGNDNNTIEHNDITNAGGNRPRHALYSWGTTGTGLENSGNTISNNNIFDFLNGSTYYSSPGISGINLYFYNSAWTITNNSFYETVLSVPTLNGSSYIIYINNTGTNYTINNNHIGGSAPECGGTPWTNTYDLVSGSPAFHCIYLAPSGTGLVGNIQGNTIKNFDYTSGYETSLWYGIYIAAGPGDVNIGTTTGNVIGSSSGIESIIFTPNAYGIITGIHIIGTGTIDCQNNIIGAIKSANKNSTKGTLIYGIRCYSDDGGTVKIINNSIGSTTTANSLFASSPSTVNDQKVYGIYSDKASVTVSGNMIANLKNASSNTTSNVTGTTTGIWVYVGTHTITNNTIRDLTISNGYLDSKDKASVVGISLSSSTPAAHTVSGNTIYNLSNTSPDFAISVTGIYYSGSTTTSTVSGNFIHGLSANSASGIINGLYIFGGTATFSNNIISLGSGSATGNEINGLRLNAATASTMKFYHNTVYLGGTVTGVTANTYALRNATVVTTRDFRNNIFNNSRSSGTTGKHYAASITSTTNLTECDYNDYYAPNGLLGYLGGDITSLSNWRTATGKDVNSVNIDPSFTVNPPDTAAYDYRPTATLAGDSNTGPVTDYESATRAATPTIGAFEVTNSCANPTSGGIIASDETICPDSIPAEINSTSLPTGHSGDLEFQWQQSTTSATTGFAEIAGANDTTYQSVALSDTTWFRRLARVSCKTDWTGCDTSNVVEIIVLPDFTPGAIESVGDTICYNGDPAEIGSDTDAGGGDENITYAWYSSTNAFTDSTLISGASDATYTPPTGLTVTTNFRRYAKDDSCNTDFEVSTGTWTVTVYDEFTAGAIETDGDTICYNGDPAIIGSTAATIDNGSIISSVGTGYGGNNVSIVRTGGTTLGFGNQQITGNSVMDDFTLLTSKTINSIEFLGYQTGSTTTSTFTGLYFRIYDGEPGAGGNVIWGDFTTNRMTSTSFSNTYRVIATDISSSTRPIMNIVCEGLTIPLNAGTYWLEWQATGTLVSGPWQPPTTSLTGNARHHLPDGYIALLDGTDRIGVELPFTLRCIGSVDASGGDGNISYQWYSSTNDFTDSTLISGASDTTYDPPTGLTVDTWYRRQAKDGTCNTSWNTSTGVWKVTVETTPPTACSNAIEVLNTNDSGAGSLRQAITDLCSGGTITFNSSLNAATITLTSGELLIDSSLTIDASALTDGIIVDGNDVSRIINMNSSAASDITIKNLVLTNGASIANGAGIYMATSNITLVLVDVDIKNCDSDNGGAIFQNGGSLTISGAVFESNTAKNGGAIYSINNSNCSLVNSTIKSNQATVSGGGGFWVHDGCQLTLTNCQLYNNSSPTWGGGIIILSGATGTLINCTLSQNASGLGGGLYNTRGTFVINNSIYGEILLHNGEIRLKPQKEFRPR